MANHNFIQHIDPDENFFNSFIRDQNSNINSEYFTIEKFNSTFSFHPSTFSFLNFNIRSYNKNFDYFDCFMNSLYERPDAFAMCETWHSSDSFLPNFYENYEIFHTVRTDGRGGGVSVYVDQKYIPSLIPHLSICNEYIESCCVKLNLNSHFNFVLLSIYRPPNSSVSEFIRFLVEFLNTDTLLNSKIIISGDFNLSILCGNNLTSQLEYELQSLGFISLITKPTRFDPNPNISPSLLDHIWINFFQSFSSGIFLVDITDHCPTFLLILPDSPKPPNEQCRKIVFRDHSESNLINFSHKFSTINWNLLLSGSVNQMFRTFQSTINQIYYNSCPLKTKFISNKRLGKPWLSTELLKLIQCKSHYFKLMKSGLIDYEWYKSYKNNLLSSIRRAKKSYYINVFSKSYGSNNMRRVWSTVHEVLRNSKSGKRIDKIVDLGHESVENMDIANVLNNYFVSVGVQLSENIPSTHLSPFHYVDSNPRTFFLNPVHPDELCSIIENLKKNSNKLHNLPCSILKQFKNIFSRPLSQLINESFKMGVFPDDLKLAEVVPIH